MDRRPWNPLGWKRLKEIRNDTEADAPQQDYSAAEVYDIVSELIERRDQADREKKRRKPRPRNRR